MAGGQFVVNGAAQTSGQELDLTPAQAANTVYDVGTAGGTVFLYAQLDVNGTLSGWQQFAVTAPVDTGPVVTPASTYVSVIGPQSLAVSSLFTYSDPVGSPASLYDVWDTGAGGGHFVLNGAALGANQDNIITAAQMAQLTYQVGTGTDTLSVRANDGAVWGAWSTYFTVSDPPAGAGSAYSLVAGSAANQLLQAGANGNDTLLGGAGANDSLYGGAGGSDSLVAGSGDFQLLQAGADSHDTLVGGTGSSDSLYGGVGGGDSMIGGSGPDQFIVGQFGNNTIFAGTGGDTIDASGGNQIHIASNLGNDTINAGGAGNDVIYFDTRDYAAASIGNNNGVTTLSFDSGAQTIQINAAVANLVFEDRTVRI
jgi:hypothetical protein